MKWELGIARCGLACSENVSCPGCRSGGCPGADDCVNRRCSMERGLEGCWACGELDGCRKGLLAKSKPRGFSLFVRRYGMQAMLDRLERNEQAGVVYHRTGVVGDYDGFDSEEALIAFLLAQEREPGCSSP